MSLVEIAAGLFIMLVVFHAIGQRGMKIIDSALFAIAAPVAAAVLLAIPFAIGMGSLEKGVEIAGALLILAPFILAWEYGKEYVDKRWPRKPQPPHWSPKDIKLRYVFAALAIFMAIGVIGNGGFRNCSVGHHCEPAPFVWPSLH